MGDVVRHGRTVLFVSHNIGAIKSLCQTGLYLEQGRVADWGTVDDAVGMYLRGSASNLFDGDLGENGSRPYSTGEARLRSVQVVDDAQNPLQAVITGQPLSVSVKWEVLEPFRGMVEVGIMDSEGRQITQSFSTDGGIPAIDMTPGRHEIRLRIDDAFFPGRYSLLAGIHKTDGATIDFVERALDFEVLNAGRADPSHYQWGVRGYLRPSQTWGPAQTLEHATHPHQLQHNEP